MGMFNEVYATCHGCGGTCTMQIPQIVLGFGQFNLNKPETLKKLDPQEKHELKQYVEEKAFWCRKCGPFKVDIEITETNKLKVRI